MDCPELEESEILKFYSNSTIFLTGATGYLGKMVLEKLLRECLVNKIYVLIRSKKGKDEKSRLEEVFDGPSMDPLKRKRSDFRQKVTLVAGDCSLPDLGLDEEVKEMLVEEVDCVIHCAATVRFDEKLRRAAYINVRGLIDLVTIAKQMKYLKAMVYISTAFSQCCRKEVDEKFYKPPIHGLDLLSIVDALDDTKLDKITPILLGDYPNTYVFTKAVAEYVIKDAGKSLPVAVFRPSIVIASVKEPVAGWIDNLYGATGALVGGGLGILHSLHGKNEIVAEMVPADFVVNCALAIAWEISSTARDRESKDETDPPVYNFVSSTESPITWGEYSSLAQKHGEMVPSVKQMWHRVFYLRSPWIYHKMTVILYETIPAYIVDFVAICLRRKPVLIQAYKKIHKFGDVISHFSTREWEFSNNNVQDLWKKLNSHDKKLFDFSMQHFNWDLYFYTYIRGIRVYLVGDPLNTVEAAFRKQYKLKILHYAVVTFVLFLLCMLFYMFFYIFT